MPPPTPEFSDRIREEIINSGLDPRYKPGAYEFVMGGLDFCLSKLGEKRHVSGQEFSRYLLMLAHRQFGLLAKSVLDDWGVKTTGDLGCIVYNMIRIGIMDKRPEDSLDDFYDVVDIDALFKAVEYFQIDKEFIRRLRGV